MQYSNYGLMCRGKTIWDYKDLSYEERLSRCWLTILERRSRGDLIEKYKIITGKKVVQWKQLQPNKEREGHNLDDNVVVDFYDGR